MGSSILIVILSNLVFDPKALIIWDLVEPLFRETSQTNSLVAYLNFLLFHDIMSKKKIFILG